MSKIISASIFLAIIIICKSSAGPLSSKAGKIIVDDVAFYKLGTYRGFANDGAEYQKTFFFSRYSKTFWGDSKAICKAFDFELASMETLQEANALLTMADNHSHFRGQTEIILWIDGIALTPLSKTDWYWSKTGEKIDFPIPWLPNQPNSADQRCLSIYKTTTQIFGFNDGTCSDTSFLQRFICERVDFYIP